MKVEKCPQCTLAPDVARKSKWYGRWIFYIRIHGYIIWEKYFKCHESRKEFFSLTENGCYRKWNRWARREAKRIAREKR